MSSTYYEHFKEALPDPARLEKEQKKLEDAGVKYILSCWIDMFGQPKTKPVPISDFVPLCMGKGPQFAVHSISFVPELGPADSDQVPLPDIDTIQICPWDPTQLIQRRVEVGVGHCLWLVPRVASFGTGRDAIVGSGKARGAPAMWCIVSSEQRSQGRRGRARCTGTCDERH